MSHRLAADSVVYEESPERAAALVANGGEYVSGKTGGNFNTPVAVHIPTSLVLLARQTGPPLRLRGATTPAPAPAATAGSS